MQQDTPANEPRITAEITFLRTDEGGRRTAPQFPSYWFLHVVIQDRDMRDCEVQEPYRSVRIIEAPTSYELGESGSFVLAPMYYAEDPFPEFKQGATFTVREGAKIVARGVVLGRVG